MVMESGLSRRSLLKIGAGCGAAAVLSPVVAVTGTALGFYFGGRGSSG